MKIVILPGVGFHFDHTKYDTFAKHIGELTDCDSEVFYWKHEWPLPEIKLPYGYVRSWTYEVILDFQQVVLHSDMEVPKADFYIGHSAGSVIALAQKEVPCIIFGSPACLIECIQKSQNSSSDFNIRLMESIRSKYGILNIINEYDQLAYYLDLPNVENWSYKGSWWKFDTYNPMTAHTSYWENESVANKLASTIKTWKNVGL